MNRSIKKMKMDSVSRSGNKSTNNNGSSIHSGHYMTSYLHDQNEDTVEMPIASPDATINEVTLNTTLNTDQDHFENEASHNQVTSMTAKTQPSTNNIPSQNPNQKLNSVNQIANNSNNINTNPNNTFSNYNQVLNIQTIRKVKLQMISGCTSISGGLTLDKMNKSLKNLMYYIKSAYSNNLTSPKWKNFKGLKLQVTEKIRLNNIIWRSWFEQYGSKDSSKRKRRLICQFANGLEEQPVSTKMSIKEGKFWKARLESITNEYKKWREISRKQIKATNDGTQLDNVNNLMKLIDNNNKKLNLSSTKPTSRNLSSSNLNNLNNNNFANNNNTSIVNNRTSFSPGLNLNQISSSLTNNLYDINNQIQTIPSNFQVQPLQETNQNSAHQQQQQNFYYQNNFNIDLNTNNFNQQQQVIVSNNSSTDNFSNFNSNYNQFSSLTNNNNNNNNNIQHNQSSVIITTATSSSSPTSSFTTQANSNTALSYHQLPIASKQMPYNNRCRSPSPGLFQDFDLYNFSSDTLFSTYLIEDPKDTIFGTNPDFFQPDLMHLYPNFDFFDLQDSDLFKITNSTDVDSEQNSPQSSNTNLNFNTNNTNPATENTIQVVVQEAQQVAKETPQEQNQIINIDYLSNFNTLATVAAAQSVNINVNQQQQANPVTNQHIRPQRQRHVSDLGDISHLKTNNQTVLNDINQIKMPVSLSQINSSLNNSNQTNNNPIQFNSNNSNSNSSFNRSVSSNSSSSSSISSTNGATTSSNTIRNLLALNSSPIQLSNSKQNLRVSTGVLTASNSTIPSPNSNLKQPSQSSLIHQLSPQNQTKLKADTSNNQSQAISNLLSAVLSGPAQPNDIQILPLTNQEQIVEIQNLNTNKPPPNKRGRKSIAETLSSQKSLTNSRTNLSARSSSQNKSKKDEIILTNSQINANLNESDNSTNSPIESPPTNNNNSLNNSFNSIQIAPTSSSNLNNDSNTNEFSLLSKYNRITSNPASSNTKQELYQSSNIIAASRMSRSNSVNSLNINDNNNLTTAEQKRRCNIQHGFDRLQVLVPSLKDGKNLKVSKAVMLQKTSEYIKELQLAREKRMNDLDVYKKEIQELSDRITECQNQLPANGVSVIGNLNKTEKFEQKFNAYVKDKTVNNWKFYLFSLILKPLFDNFIQTVNTSSKEDMEKTFYEWQQKYCNLTQLRPIASNALRNLSRSTSILTEPNKLPQECYSTALTKI